MKIVNGNIFNATGFHIEYHKFDNQNSTYTHLFDIGGYKFFETLDIFQQFLMIVYVNDTFKVIPLGGIFVDAYKYFLEEKGNYKASAFIDTYWKEVLKC